MNQFFVTKNLMLIVVLILGGGLASAGAPDPGNVLWTDKVDGSDNSSDIARAVKVVDRYVFAVGSVVNQGTDDDFFVRAYDAKKGHILWEDVVIGSANYGEDIAYAVDYCCGKVFVAGVVRDAITGADFTVRAYRARDGHLLWEDRHDVAGGFDRAFAVSASWRGVSVAGNLDLTGTASELVMAVRTYKPWNGELLWEDATLGDGASGIANDVDTSNCGIAAIVGTSRGPDLSGAFTVRAYDNRRPKRKK